MRKNPFSIYDFLGYVFPGFLVIFLIWIFTKDDLCINCLKDLYKTGFDLLIPEGGKDNFLMTIEATIILTIIAYITGHLTAYLSSITIEPFANRIYGYPSRYLLGIKREVTFSSPFKDLKARWRQVWKTKKIKNIKIQQSKYRKGKIRNRLVDLVESFFRVIIWIMLTIFLFPISVCTLIVHRWLRIKISITKPLDTDLKKAIIFRSKKLHERLNIKVSHRKSDYHRIVYHYVYEKMGTHSPKLDNYVALYGFLRSLTFISNCVFLVLFIIVILPTYEHWREISPNWALIRMMSAVGVVTYIFYLSFVKFYRRFTLESLMCLLTCTEFPKAANNSVVSKKSENIESNSMQADNADSTNKIEDGLLNPSMDVELMDFEEN